MASFAAALMAGVAAKYGGRPRPPRRRHRHHARPGDRHGAAASSSCTTRCRAAPGTCTASPTRPNSARCSKVPAASSRTAPARTRASPPATAACSATSATTSSPSSPAPRRSRMLDDLLGDWATASVPDTGEISLWDQVESELEARFLKVLEDWARRFSRSVLYRRGAVLNGYRTADLRISRRTGSRALAGDPAEHHRGHPPGRGVPAGGRRPADRRRLPRRVRLPRGARTRTGSPTTPTSGPGCAPTGTVVFQLDWDDVNAAAGDNRRGARGRGRRTRATRRQPRAARTPARRRPGRAARAHLVHPGADPVRVPRRPRPRGLVAPRAGRGRRAASPAGGRRGQGRSTTIAERVMARCPRRPACPGRRRPGHAGARGGRERLPGHRHHRSASPGPRDRAAGYWTALVVIDDRLATIMADEQAHERRWAAWLYWGNLIQFLDEGGGDGVPARLDRPRWLRPVRARRGRAVPGWCASLMLGQARRSARRSCPCWARCGQAPSPGVAVDPQWAGVYDLLAPEVEILTHALAERGFPPRSPTRSDMSWATRRGRLSWPGRSRGSRSSRPDRRPATASRPTPRPAGTPGCRATGRPTSWPGGSWEETDERPAAAARQGRQGDPQAAPGGQGRDLRLPAQVPRGPVQPRPAVQAARGELPAVLGAGDGRTTGRCCCR